MNKIRNSIKLLNEKQIIGAGKIGAFFDSPKDSHILTHAHAFKRNKKFHLVGFVDVDLKKADEAVKTWGGKAFSNISEAFRTIKCIDIAVVSSPDETHARVIEELSQYPLKLIFLEKPLAKTLDEARNIVDLCTSKHLPVLINYSRRFVKEFQESRERIKTGTYGDYLTGMAYYGKGVLHNGSHIIDLVLYLIGEIERGVCLEKIHDCYDDDPSVSAQLKLDNNREFFLQAVDARIVTVCELDIIFEKARIKITDSDFKIQEFEIADSQIFEGYKIFKPIRSIVTSQNRALEQAVKNIEGYLLRDEILECDMYDGLKAVEIATQLVQKAIQR